MERATLLETKEKFAKEKEEQEEELRVMNQKMQELHDDVQRL